MHRDQELTTPLEPDTESDHDIDFAVLGQLSILLVSDMPGLVAAREILGDKVLETGEWDFKTKRGLRIRRERPNWPRIYPILNKELCTSWNILEQDCESYWEFHNRFGAGKRAFGINPKGDDERMTREEAHWKEHLSGWRKKLPLVSLPDTFQEALPRLNLQAVSSMSAPEMGYIDENLWIWSGGKLHLLEECYYYPIY
jgi:hypothetical protein